MALDNRKLAFVFAGLSLLGIGVLQLSSGQILVGRPPLPSMGEWYGPPITWTVSALLIIKGVLVIMRKAATVVSGILAAFIICYCVLPNLWLLVNGDIGIALTSFGKGISLATGLLVLRAAAPDERETRRNQVIIHACNYCFGVFLTASGIQHFVFAAFVVTLIPSWIPFPEFWTYAAGGLLVASGLCLITGFKRTMALSFSALMIFSWVLIVHIPRAFFTVQNINEWTALSEALAFASLLFILSRAEFIDEKLIARNFYRSEITDIWNDH
jgi:uncharacterized membrane protein